MSAGRLAVFDFAGAEDAALSGDWTHIVSIGDPHSTVPDLARPLSVELLRLEFEDIEAEDPRHRAPRLEDAQRLIKFLAGIPDEANVLLHCHAGISRSTAAALILLFLREKSEAQAGAALLKIRPRAMPNLLLIRYADAILGCSLEAVAREITEQVRRELLRSIHQERGADGATVAILDFNRAVAALAAGSRWSYVVSFGDPGSAPPSRLYAVGRAVCRQEFLDFEEDADAGRGRLAEMRDIVNLIDFLRKIAPEDTVLFHCNAGLSRSTAAALLLFYLRDEDETRAKSRLLAIKPKSLPNRLMIRYADELLGTELERVCAEIYDSRRAALLRRFRKHRM